MSTADDRILDEHASLHLDGEISDAEWQRLSAEHGDALVAAVARERALRGAIRSLPRAPAPLAVREAIAGHLARPAARSAPRSRRVVTGWFGFAAALAAAGVVVAIMHQPAGDPASAPRGDATEVATLETKESGAPMAASAPSAPASIGSDVIVARREAADKDSLESYPARRAEAERLYRNDVSEARKSMAAPATADVKVARVEKVPAADHAIDTPAEELALDREQAGGAAAPDVAAPDVAAKKELKQLQTAGRGSGEKAKSDANTRYKADTLAPEDADQRLGAVDGVVARLDRPLNGGLNEEAKGAALADEGAIAGGFAAAAPDDALAKETLEKRQQLRASDRSLTAERTAEREQAKLADAAPVAVRPPSAAAPTTPAPGSAPLTASKPAASNPVRPIELALTLAAATDQPLVAVMRLAVRTTQAMEVAQASLELVGFDSAGAVCWRHPTGLPEKPLQLPAGTTPVLRLTLTGSHALPPAAVRLTVRIGDWSSEPCVVPKRD